jgi:ubiquinone/menaquinone biosynthesis C-methylase UbiE
MESEAMPFTNTYEDAARAAAYADLEFPGTYYLAFRDLPELLGAPTSNSKALDFGCGAGRSVRFMQGLGFNTDGADCSEAMLAQARLKDPEGSYFHVPNGDLSVLPDAGYDRILAAFPFDNIPNGTPKLRLFRHLARLLRPGGRLLNLVSSEALYRHEWASFSTRDFPGNALATGGDPVFTVMKDVLDARPVEDIFCPESEYRALYQQSGLRRLIAHRPLGRREEPFQWISEPDVSPWRIDVLEVLG